MNKQYRSLIMAFILQSAEGLRGAGVTDKRTMHRFDETCPTLVRAALRERELAMLA